MPPVRRLTLETLAARVQRHQERLDALDDQIGTATPLVWHMEIPGFVPDGDAEKFDLTFAPEPADLLLLFIQGAYQPTQGMVFGQTVDLGWAPPIAVGAGQITAVYPYDPDRVFESVDVIASCIGEETEYDPGERLAVLEEDHDITGVLVALGLA